MNDHVIHLENGKLAADTPREAVDIIAQKAVRHRGSGGIVLHFHGGLVNHAAGIGIANRLRARYELEGDSYPVFFVWEAGLLETITNNLGEIAGERFFRRVWKRVVEIVRRKFAQSEGDRAAGVLPPVDSNVLHRAIDDALARLDSEPLDATASDPPAGLTELSDAERFILEHELVVDPVLAVETQLISNGMRPPATVEAEIASRASSVRGSSRTLMDPRALDRLVDRPAPGARGILSTVKVAKAVVAVAARVISRFVRQRHHGFHATAVEEILRELYLANVGELIWTTMKKDTADSFGGDGSVHGGTALLQALRQAVGDANPPRITLVGHSTGAVYISEFLDHAAVQMPTATRYGVVLLAPASTFDKTSASLDRHRDRIDGFRMFSMTDENERGDALVPVLYPHSLLYFVSGVVEEEADTPLVGMERFYDSTRFGAGDFPAVENLRAFVHAAADRAIWSVTDQGAPGRLSASLKHGDFDNDDQTLASVAHILARGFQA